MPPMIAPKDLEESNPQGCTSVQRDRDHVHGELMPLNP